jgi:hypothetical protein
MGELARPWDCSARWSQARAQPIKQLAPADVASARQGPTSCRCSGPGRSATDARQIGGGAGPMTNAREYSRSPSEYAWWLPPDG